MDEQARVIVVEQGQLEALLTKIVTNQNRALVEELREMLHRKDNPLDGDHITTKQLMAELGVTRNTIQNWRKAGTLPPPDFDLSDRPYWTAKQLETFMNERKAKRKYPS